MLSKNKANSLCIKTVLINQRGYKINKPKLISWVKKVGEELKRQKILNHPLKGGQTSPSITLVFVNEEEITQLNSQFRKKPLKTDILSFAPLEDSSLGELVLCLPVVAQTKPPFFSREEWLYYLILHGFLHLLGFEHEKNQAKAQKMYQLQDDIFKKLY